MEDTKEYTINIEAKVTITPAKKAVPLPEPAPKDPEPKPFLVDQEGRAIDDIVREVNAYAVNNPDTPYAQLKDGWMLGGDMREACHLPLVGGNAQNQVKLHTPSNELRDFRFIATADGGLRITAPGNRIYNPTVKMGEGPGSFRAGITVNGELSYSPTALTIINGAKIENWGHREEVAIKIGNSDNAASNQTEKRFLVEHCEILNGDNGGYSVPIQTYWPTETRHNLIDGYNGEGIQEKCPTGRSWHHRNYLANNASTGRGALYDRSTRATNNTWEFNIVVNTVFPIDHYGSSLTRYSNNILDGYARPGRFQNMTAFQDVFLSNNTWLNARRVQDVTNGGFTWGAGEGVPSGILIEDNIFHRHLGPVVQSSQALINAWRERGNYYWKTAAPNGKNGQRCISPSSYLSQNEHIPECAHDNPPKIAATNPLLPGSYTRSPECVELGVGANAEWYDFPDAEAGL